ncbi:DUF3530 domain-containing protein [Alteromonas sp. S015]|uniref:DUF3530 domain-containing protein n=1 Tax=Alteromonas sp. S015 TaxID=3117401 RepID=UPI002FDF70F3
MKRHALPLIFSVIASLLPITAHCDFFTDVSHAYLPGEVKPLMVGEVETPIIEVEAQTPLPLGVAIILTEAFPSSLTLAQGDSLASILAEKGWNVVISPFNLPVNAVKQQSPPEESTDTVSSDPETASMSAFNIHPRSNQLTQYLSFESATSAMNLQLNALDNYLQNSSGYRMVIAQGMLATTYLSVVEQQPQLHPDTFVAISPFWPEASTNTLVIDNIARSTFPILDLSLSGFNDWANSTTQKRKVSAKNALKIHYRQIIIPKNLLAFSIKEFQNSPYIQMVANSTIGWTRHLGW